MSASSSTLLPCLTLVLPHIWGSQVTDSQTPRISMRSCLLYMADRVVSGSRKFDRGLTHLINAELHWLDVPERVKYKLGMITRRCLNGTAPQYLAASLCDCTKATKSAFCWQYQLVVLSYRLSSYGLRAFSVAGPTTWNSLGLPRHLRDPVHTTSDFARLLKTFFLFRVLPAYAAHWGLFFGVDALYKLTFSSLNYLLYVEHNLQRVFLSIVWCHLSNVSAVFLDVCFQQCCHVEHVCTACQLTLHGHKVLQLPSIDICLETTTFLQPSLIGWLTDCIGLLCANCCIQ